MFGDKKADCPLWRAPCKEHGCRWWMRISGTSANTGLPIDRFECAIAILPELMLENTQQARQAGASFDKMSTELNRFRASMESFNTLALDQNGHAQKSISND